MAYETFKPNVWAARLLANLHKAHIFTQSGVVNRNYEGEISQYGDTVNINNIGAVTIGDYTGTDIGTPEDLSDEQRTLLIDQAKYFNFKVDDVDKAQSKPTIMDEAMREASYGLNDTADQFIAGMHTGVDSANAIGTAANPKDVDANNVYDALLALKERLDKANVPKQGRWVTVPTWFENHILNAKIITDTDPQSMIQNGVIGRVAGFDIMSSLNIAQVTDGTAGDSDVIMAGYPGAISYAEQIVKVNAYQPEGLFADAVKGLHVYGGKLVRPEGIATLVAQNGSTSTFA